MTIIVDEIGAGDYIPRSVSQVGSRGPSGTAPKTALIIAPLISGGTGTADLPTRILGQTYGDALFTSGSPVAEMCRAFKAVNKSAVLDAIGIADDGSGVVATGSLGLAGTATASGTLQFRVYGRLYSQGVAVGDTAATLLTALKATIDADARRSALAGTIASSAIPVTSRFKGVIANSGRIHQIGDNVAGITVAITQPVNGATDGSVTAAIAAISSTKYDTIICAFNNATAMAAFETEMARRNTADVGKQGTVMVGVHGSLSTATTYAGSRNSRFVVSPATGISPTPPWIWAAQIAAKELLTIESDGGAVVIDVPLPDCVPPDVADRFDEEDRATLVAAGMSTYYVADDVAYIEMLVTNYLTDTSGASDETYRPQRSMRIVGEYRDRLKTLNQKFRSFKLVNNDAVVQPGVKALTENFYKASIQSHYEKYAETGNVEDTAYFEANCRAERSGKNRMYGFHPITIGGQVITIADLIEVG